MGAGGDLGRVDGGGGGVLSPGITGGSLKGGEFGDLPPKSGGKLKGKWKNGFAAAGGGVLFIIVGKGKGKSPVNLGGGGEEAIPQKTPNGEKQASALLVRMEKIASRFKSSIAKFFPILIHSLFNWV